MTDINRQLCEMLGIPAKYKNKHLPTAYWGKVSPDFSKPENFVKLITLKSYTGVTLFQEITAKMSPDDFNKGVEGFLKVLYELFYNNKYSVNFENSIKHAAQQVEWVY